MRHARRSLQNVAFHELDTIEKAHFRKWQLKRKADWLEWKEKHPHSTEHEHIEIEDHATNLNLKQLDIFNQWKDEMHTEMEDVQKKS